MRPAARIGAIAAGLAAAAAAVGFAYHAASARPRPMDPGEYGRIAARIASLAAETRLLADLLLEDRATHHFTRAHLEHLEELVNDQASDLEQPAAPGLDVQALRALRERLQAQVKDTRRHLSEPQAVARIRGEAGRIHDEAQARTPPR